jgi:dienelactone hydrolase
MIRHFLICCLSLGLLCSGSAHSQEPDAQEPLRAIGDEAFAAMARWFDYDPQPSNMRSTLVRNTAQGRVYQIVFNSVGKRQVPAYLELPLHGEAPYPCVVLIHGVSRSKEFWWTYGTTTEGKHKDRLVGEGFAVLGIDLPLHGVRAAEGDYIDPSALFAAGAESRLRNLFRDSVVDHRRAIDALWSRADIDSSRIGLLGYDLGGSVAFALAAVETRVQVSVACVPPTMRDGLSVLAAQNYAPRIRKPFLMLMAANSRTSSPEDASQLRELMSAPSAEMKIYTSDDRLPIWYVGDAVSWFTTHLTP